MSFLDKENVSGVSLKDRSVNTAASGAKDLAQMGIATMGNKASTPLLAAAALAASKVAQAGMNEFLAGLNKAEENAPLYTTGTENTTQYTSATGVNSDTATMTEFINSVNDAPAMKHMFICEFTLDRTFQAKNVDKSKSLRTITSLVKNTTFPSASIETGIYNEYNRRRIHARKIQYQDINLSMGEVINHYGSAGDKHSALAFWQSITSDLFNDTSMSVNNNGEPDKNIPYGYRQGKKTYSNPILFFDIFIIGYSVTKRIRMLNPFITTFNYDNLDYNTDDQIIANMTISYDSFVIQNYKTTAALNNTAVWEDFNKRGLEPIKDMVAIVIPPELPPIEDTRDLGFDNPLTQSLMDAAETTALMAGSKLINSNDPLKRLAGQTALSAGLDVAASGISLAGGATDAAWDKVGGAAKGLGSKVGGKLGL